MQICILKLLLGKFVTHSRGAELRARTIFAFLAMLKIFGGMAEMFTEDLIANNMLMVM